MFVPITRYTGEDINDLKNEGKFVINTRYIRYIEKVNEFYHLINLDTGKSVGLNLYVTTDDVKKIVDSMNVISEIKMD